MRGTTKKVKSFDIKNNWYHENVRKCTYTNYKHFIDKIIIGKSTLTPLLSGGCIDGVVVEIFIEIYRKLGVANILVENWQK